MVVPPTVQALVSVAGEPFSTVFELPAGTAKKRPAAEPLATALLSAALYPPPKAIKATAFPTRFLDCMSLTAQFMPEMTWEAGKGFSK